MNCQLDNTTFCLLCFFGFVLSVNSSVAGC
jgi:hypothetical protein